MSGLEAFLGREDISPDVKEEMRQCMRELSELRRYKDIVGSMQMGLFVYKLEDLTDDRTLKIIDCNPASVKLTNIPAEDIFNRTIDDLFPKLPERGVPKMFADVVRTGKTIEIEDFTYGDGRIIDSSWSYKAFPLPDNCVGVVFENITERKKKLEERLAQSQKLEALGQLAGGVAHDFNNILTAIIGYSEVSLNRLSEADPLYHDIEEIKKSGERARGLTKQLLAFSKQQVIKPRTLKLNDIVNELNGMLNRVIGEHIQLECYLDDDLYRVNADPGQIEQVIENLAVNARDAMVKGGTLTIRTANAEIDEEYAGMHSNVKAGLYALLEVTDTGKGIPADILPRIFEPFFTTKPQGKGTGLGLSTVYGIVKQSNGHINVDSEVGRGTTFSVYLPRNERSTTVLKLDKNSGNLRGTETILLVEDETVVRTITNKILKENGYTVFEAASPCEALTLCENLTDKIHLLLTDMVLPKMNGIELAERISKLLPNVRVLYTSGYAKDQSIFTPDMHFVEKPYAIATLLGKVRECLDKCTE